MNLEKQSIIEPIMSNAIKFLRDGQYEVADQYFEKVLLIEADFPEAYIGKLLADLKVSKIKDIYNFPSELKNNVNYQKALRLTMAEGRFYTSEMMNDTTSVVINQTAARIISEKESAVGKFITYGPYRLNIIGVVNDFHFKSVHRKIEPLILVFLPKECYVSFVRIGPGNQEHYLKHIEKVYKKYSTEQPYFARFLDTELNNLYTAEKRMSVIFKYFAVLAIFISCLGLFGLSLYTAEQKTKEIGIRKTMGASVQSIVWLFLKQYFRWVAVATVIAMPIAWYTM